MDLLYFCHNFFSHANDFNFLKDLLPVLISSLAIIVSVLAPYLIVRYEKIFAKNKEYVDFLGQAEIYFLEWLNVTAYNKRVTVEFITTLSSPNAVYARDVQFYDLPVIGFFRTYNIQLLNEFYILVRKIKELDYHLRMISAEYAAYKRTLTSRDAFLMSNGNVFYVQALTSIQPKYDEAIVDITDLRIKVRLLLKEANDTNTVSMEKFFSFGQNNRLWYKKDLQFSAEEITAERVVLENEQRVAREAE